MVKLIINSAEGLIGVIEDYDGPIPRDGEVILHPPLGDDGTSDLGLKDGKSGCMTVKGTPLYGILGRPQNGEKHFTGRAKMMVRCGCDGRAD